MLTVIETPEFIASANAVWTDLERVAFIDWISDHSQAGDVIPGAGQRGASALAGVCQGQAGQLIAGIFVEVEGEA